MLEELARRRVESLRLYEPLPFQQAYHACRTKEALLMKANRAGGEQPLTQPVLTPIGFIPIGDINVGDKVVGGDGLPCLVTEVIEYGDSPVYRLTYSDGTTCEAGENHKWTCRLGGRAGRPSTSSVNQDEWEIVTTKEIANYVEKYGCRFGVGRGSSHFRICFPVAVSHMDYKPVPLDPYLLGVLIGDGNYTHGHVMITSEDQEIIDSLAIPAGCKIGKITNKSTSSPGRFGKASLYSITGTGYRTNAVRDGLKELGLNGKRGWEKFIPECYLYNSVEVRLGLLQGLLDTDGRCGKTGFAQYYTTSSRMVEDITVLVRSLGGRVTVNWRENGHDGRPGRPLAHVTITIPEFNPFRLSRKRVRRDVQDNKYRNFRYLEKIEQIGTKQCRCINVDNASRTYITNDFIVTHNSLCGFAEDARAATNQDPHRKYPEKDGIIVCLGYGEGHIGRVIHRYLFRPGAFDIIQDLKTKEWRVFRPWERDREFQGRLGDKGREKETLPAPPLIPKRFIKGKIAWVKRAHYVFYRVDLTTGWSIYAANSAGNPSQFMGFDVNLYHIDEDLATPGWYDEALPRTTKPNGFMRWTALPLAMNDDLMNLTERFEREQDSANRTTTLLTASIFDNPFLPREAVEHNIKIWASHGDDVLQQRAYGKLQNNEVKVYPSFNSRTLDYRKQLTDTCRILKERNGEPPEKWCRYLTVDPGHTVLAISYFAVPPSGDQAYLYKEDYILGGDAMKFGEAVAKASQGTMFQAFIIDSHGGNLRELGSGLTPREQFSRQLQARAVRSVDTGFDFLNGSDDIKGREMILRDWIRVREDGSTKLIINVDNCPNFIREMERFKKKVIQKGSTRLITEDSDRRFNSHSIETVEYGVSHGLKYVKPPVSVTNKSWVERMLDAEKAHKARFRVINGVGSDRTISLGPRGSSK